MAARRLDPSAAHWVALVPSPDFDGWISALTDAAAAAGWNLVRYTGGDLPELKPRTVVVVTDAAHAGKVEPKCWTIIATGLDGAAGAATAYFEVPPDQGVWVASRLLAAACGLPEARWVVDANLTGQAIDILPGLTVTPPGRKRPGHSKPAAATALALYADGPPRVGAGVWWGPDLFSYDQRRRPLGPHPRHLDLTGAPRILVFGPYVSLPAGLWRATVSFSVNEGCVGRRYHIEWGDQAAFDFHPFRPDAAGEYQVEIQHRWAASGAAEMRLVLEEGAIDGALTFEGLRLERLE